MKIRKIISRITKELSKLNKNRIEILLYHSINEDENIFLKSSHNIIPDIFRKQMKYLSDNFQVISLKEIKDILQNNKKNGPYVSICFDDGYSSVITNANPILEEYNLPATLFICPSVINNEDILWRDKIRFIINSKIEDQFINYLKKNSSKSIYNFQLLNNYSFYVWSKHELAFSNMSIQEDLNNFFDFNNINISDLAKVKRLYILEEEIKKYKYLEFGNHTWSHPILTKLTYKEQKEEIINTHNYLLSKGVSPYSLSLPFSPYNSSTIEICKDLNYNLILNVSDKANLLNKLKDDLFIIHRKMSPKTLEGLRRILKF